MILALVVQYTKHTFGLRCIAIVDIVVQIGYGILSLVSSCLIFNYKVLTWPLLTDRRTCMGSQLETTRDVIRRINCIFLFFFRTGPKMSRRLSFYCLILLATLCIFFLALNQRSSNFIEHRLQPILSASSSFTCASIQYNTSRESKLWNAHAPRRLENWRKLP